MVIKTFGAIICGASVLAVSQPMKANAATVQRAIRGTWFLKVPADPLLHTKSYVQETKNYAHSIKIKAGNSKVFVIKGRHPATNTYKTKFRYKGGKFHTVTVNVAGQGDTQGLISTHLKINGKRQHVLLGEPQNGNKFDVFTHFRPTKHYFVRGYIKY
ncbi:hypothetical protein FD05_GL000948 [Lentilactobacillus otakiensis DSM 19908 = JCM 15040]|nr:hypothetical protein FD05_GL000948 [Lentilactobacillus otakiensis DSM 19908 = JCM 15040]